MGNVSRFSPQSPNGGNRPLLFVAEEPRPYIGFEPIPSADAVSQCSSIELLRDKCLDEGSTTQTQAHIYLYTAPKLLEEVNRRSEPWPSARIVELPIKVELISKHYKCFVITVILWKHIYWVGSQLLPIYTIAISWAYCKSPRYQRWDSNPLNTNLWHMARSIGNDPNSLTTTLRLAGEPNTSLVYSAQMADSRPFEGHRLSPTHRFQVGSRTLRVYCPFCFTTHPEKWGYFLHLYVLRVEWVYISLSSFSR